MAPNLALSQQDLIRRMIIDHKRTTREITDASECIERLINAI
jgi:hypothetical protein